MRRNSACVYLRTFCEALASKGMMPRRLLFMSSLSALGNPGDRDYAPIDASTGHRNIISAPQSLGVDKAPDEASGTHYQ